jgi:hypothetical protein
MGWSNTEDRTIEVRLEPSSPRVQSKFILVPYGEVQWIAEIACLDKPTPNVEVALYIDSVRQAGFLASKLALNGFAKYEFDGVDMVYLIVTPVLAVIEPIRVRFRVKIGKCDDPVWADRDGLPYSGRYSLGR